MLTSSAINTACSVGKTCHGISATTIANAPATPYPPSFDGSVTLFGFAICAQMTIACLAMMMAGKMARDIWRARKFDHIADPAQVCRLIWLLAAGSAFIRLTPEVIYMLAWGEVSPQTIAFLLLVKRAADTLAFLPSISWMTLLMLSEDAVLFQLVRQPLPVPLLTAWPKLMRPLLAALMVFAASFLVAVGK